MKKLTAILLLLTMMLSLIACADSSAPASASSTETTAPVVTVESEATEPETTEPEDTEPETTAAAAPAVPALEDGVYQVDFLTDSSMFHINEALDGKATLTVQDGAMTVHITLVSKSILNLFPGLAEEAEKLTEWLNPTEDEVTYSDGTTEIVYGFDVPVPAIGEDFALALIGKKGTWYDHMVSVQNPVLMEEAAD